MPLDSVGSTKKFICRISRVRPRSFFRRSGGAFSVQSPLNESCLEGKDQGQKKTDREIGEKLPRDVATGDSTRGNRIF